MTNKPKLCSVKKPNPVRLIRPVNMYDPAFKKAVILYAEKKSNAEAKRRFGIHESSIRRWRKLKADILEKAKKSSKRPKKICAAGETKAVSKKLDSMPLELRLKVPTPSTSSLHSSASEQEPDILHSHALSPTKLKVTRQSTKPPQVSPKPPTPPPPIQEDVCLKWNGHHTNMQSAFPHLLLKEQYVDATLVAEGQSLKCHRVILSSCSPYFEDVLSGIGPFQHPILFMKDVPFWILKAMCDFMYAGEVKVAPDKLEEYLNVARSLKLKGIEEEEIAAPKCQVKTEPETTPDRGPELKSVRERSKEIKESKEKVKEVKEPKEKIKDGKERMKEIKEKELKERTKDSREPRERRRYQLPSPPKEMPLLKSAKVAKVTPPKADVEMPVLKSSKIARPAYASRRAERKVSEQKIETPPDASNIYDPLGLLQAVYEEPARKEEDLKTAPVKKAVPKKLKKRKISDDREESPPPVLSRKGTRSRPNRKIPKFYHPAFDRPLKRSEPESESTIIREPHTDQADQHTDQADPLMELEDIKSEPLDLDENIDIEDNIIEYDQEDLPLPEIEEVTSTFVSPPYPSKLRSIKKIKTRNSPHSEQSDITSDSLKIVDVADISDNVENTMIIPEDPLNFSPNSSLAITSVESVMEKDLVNSLGICTDMGFRISEVMSAAEGSGKDHDSESTDLGFTIKNVETTSEVKTAEDKLLLKISNVVDETFGSSAINKAEAGMKNDGENPKRICVRKDLEENILEFEFMDNSEEVDEKHLDTDVTMDTEEVHENINAEKGENLNTTCENMDSSNITQEDIGTEVEENARHLDVGRSKKTSPERVSQEKPVNIKESCILSNDYQVPELSYSQQNLKYTSDELVVEHEDTSKKLDVDTTNENEMEEKTDHNGVKSETRHYTSTCVTSEEVMLDGNQAMDESYPELPQDDFCTSMEESTSIKPNDEEPSVLQHEIGDMQNEDQFTSLKSIINDPISIEDNVYNPSDMETALPERDPLGEMDYSETNVDVPASEKMWSGNMTENIPPALSEHNAHNFESETSNDKLHNQIPETTPITENTDSNEFGMNASSHTPNLEADSIDASDQKSASFFNSNDEKASPSQYRACNDLVVTPPNLVDYTHDSMTFDEPTFQVAQVANEQMTANECNRLIDEQHSEPMSTADDTSDRTGLTNDLESIVNDLTMIVESSRSTHSVEKCDETGVIDSLENLLEK